MKLIVLAPAFGVLIAGGVCASENAEHQTDSLFGIYSSMCVKHINDIATLRNALKDRPPLPSDAASILLNGIPGSAWQIPGPHGSYALSLHGSKAFCSVHAQRASAAVVETRFAELMGQAPSPFVAARVRDERVVTKARGSVHVISYAWSTQNGERKLLFTLFTAPDAEPQATLNVLALK